MKAVEDAAARLHPFVRCGEPAGVSLAGPLGQRVLRDLDEGFVDGALAVMRDRDLKDEVFESAAQLALIAVGVFHKHGLALRDVSPSTFEVVLSKQFKYLVRVCAHGWAETFPALNAMCATPELFEAGMGRTAPNSPWESPEETAYWEEWRHAKGRRRPSVMYAAPAEGTPPGEHPAAKMDAWRAALVALYLLRRRRCSRVREPWARDPMYEAFARVAEEALWPMPLRDCETYVDAYIRFQFDPFMEDEAWEKARKIFRMRKLDEFGRGLGAAGGTSRGYFAKRPSAAETAKSLLRVRSSLCKAQT